MLAAYAAWSMGGPAWLWPLLAGWTLAIALSARLRRDRPETEPMGLSHLFQVSITSVLLLFFWDRTADATAYAPYLAGVTGGTAIVGMTLAARMGLPPLLVAGAAVVAPTMVAALLPNPAPTIWHVLAGGAAGLLAPLTAHGLNGFTARFECSECDGETTEPRHCGAIARLVRGHRWLTCARAGWAGIVTAAAVAVGAGVWL